MKQISIKTISLLHTLKYRIFYRSQIQFGKNFICNKLKICGPGKVIFGDNINAWCFAEKLQIITYSQNAVVEIGNNVRLNGATIQCREKITISEDCMIGSAIIMDTDFHHTDPTKRREKENIPTRPVSICRNVWIAGQSAILKGVTIGENSVVGFRSVVRQDIPANKVVIGNPAEVIKDLN